METPVSTMAQPAPKTNRAAAVDPNQRAAALKALATRETGRSMALRAIASRPTGVDVKPRSWGEVVTRGATEGWEDIELSTMVPALVSGLDELPGLGSISEGIAANQKRKSTRPLSPEELEFQTREGFFESAASFVRNPSVGVGQGVRSLVGILPGMIAAPAAGAAGAGIGGAAGSAVPGIGNVAGAAIGAGIGAASAMGTASALQSGSLKFLESLAEQGVDVTSGAAIRAARNTPAWNKALADAATYGLVTGGVDAASAGFAGRLAKPVGGLVSRAAPGKVGVIAGPVVGWGADATAQGLAGAGGEAAASAAIGEEVTPQALIQEFAGEFATAPAELGGMALGRLGGRRVTGQPAGAAGPAGPAGAVGGAAGLPGSPEAQPQTQASPQAQTRQRGRKGQGEAVVQPVDEVSPEAAANPEAAAAENGEPDAIARAVVAETKRLARDRADRGVPMDDLEGLNPVLQDVYRMEYKRAEAARRMRMRYGPVRSEPTLTAPRVDEPDPDVSAGLVPDVGGVGGTSMGPEIPAPEPAPIAGGFPVESNDEGQQVQQPGQEGVGRGEVLGGREGQRREQGGRRQEGLLSQDQEATPGSEQSGPEVELREYPDTPDGVARQMAKALELKPGEVVLDPSVGRGALLRAVAKAEKGTVRRGIEINPDAAQAVTPEVGQVVVGDALGLTVDPADAVIVSPPWDDRPMDHLVAAAKMVKPGGRMVALVPKSMVAEVKAAFPGAEMLRAVSPKVLGAGQQAGAIVRVPVGAVAAQPAQPAAQPAEVAPQTAQTAESTVKDSLTTERNTQPAASGTRLPTAGNPTSGGTGEVRSPATGSAAASMPPNTEPVNPTGTQPAAQPTLFDRLDALDRQLTDRLKTPVPRSKGRGRSGATTLIADLVTVAQLAAVRTLKAGLKGYAAVSKAVQAVLSERGENARAVSAEEQAQATREAMRIMREAGKNGANLEDAIAASQARATPKPSPVLGVTDGPEGRESLKARVQRTTGVTQPDDQAAQAKALRDRLADQERASAQGFQAGQRAGREAAQKPPAETLKQRLARITGQTDAGDQATISQREAMRTALRREAKAARAAAKQAREQALDEFGERLERLQERALTIRLKGEERASASGYRAGQDDSRRAARRAAKVVQRFAPPELAKRFLRAIANARKEGDADALMGRVLADLAKYRQQRAIKEAEAAFKKANPKKMTQDLREGVRTERKAFERALADLAEGSAKLDAELAGVMKLPASPIRANKVADIKGRAVALLNEARTEIVGITQRVHELRASQRHFAQVLAEGKMVSRTEVVDELLANMAKKHQFIKDTRRVKGDPDASALSKFFWLGDNRDTMAAILGDGRFGDMLNRAIVEGETRMMADENRGEEARRKIIEAEGWKWGSTELRELSAAAEGQRAKLVTLNFPSGAVIKDATPAEVAELYAVATDSDARKKILGGTPVKLARTEYTLGQSEGVKLKRADLVYLEKVIDPKLKRVVDGLKADFLKNVTPGERASYREHFGFDMPQWKGYWHTRRRREQQDPKALVGNWNESGPRSLASTSMWKERVENPGKAPYLIGDVFQTHAKMVRDAAARTHLNRPVRSLHAVLRDSAVQTAVRQRLGTGFYRNLARKAEESAVILASSNRESSTFDRVVLGGVRNLYRGFLSFNPNSILQNIGGASRVLPYIDPAYYAAGSKGMADPAVFKRMVEASPFLADKHTKNAAVMTAQTLGETSEVLGPLMAGDLRKRLSLVKLAKNPTGLMQWFRDAGTAIDRVPLYSFGDSRPSVFTWAAKEAEVNAKHPEWSAKRKTEWVARETEALIRRTQQPHTTIGMPTLQAAWRGTWKAAFVQFTSDAIAQTNMLRSAYFRHGVKSREFWRAVAATQLNTVVSNVIRFFFRNGVRLIAAGLAGNEDERYLTESQGRGWVEQFARFMLTEHAALNAGSVYFGSQVYELGEALVAAMTDRPSRSADMALTPIGRSMADTLRYGMEWVKAISKDVEGMSDADRERLAEQRAKALERTLTTGLPLAGVPLVPIYNLYKRAVRGATGQADAKVTYGAATERLKAGDPAEAGRILRLIMRQEPDRAKAIDKARTALIRRGPMGTLTETERTQVLRSMPAAERDRVVTERREWTQNVNRAIREARERLGTP